MTDKIVVPLLITLGETQVKFSREFFFNITSFPVENNHNPKLIMMIVFYLPFTAWYSKQSPHGDRSPPVSG